MRENLSSHDWNLTPNTSIRNLSEDSVLSPSSLLSSWGDASVILHPGAKLQEWHHHGRDCGDQDPIANRFGFRSSAPELCTYGGRYANACRLTLSQDCRRHSKNDPLGRKIFKQLRFMRASGFPGFAICLICRFLVRSLSHCLVLVRLKTYSTFDSPKNCRDLCVQVTLFVVESPLYTSHTLPSLPRAP